GMYVTRSPHVEPSPTAASTSAAVWPTTMPTSTMPASAIARRAWNRMGVLAIGMSCLALVWVMGRRRDPSPPERTSALMARSAAARGAAGRRRGGRDRVPRVVRRDDQGDVVVLELPGLRLDLGHVAQIPLQDVGRRLPGLVGREHDRGGRLPER